MRKYLFEIKNRVLLLLLCYFSIILTTYYYKEILLFIIIKPKYLFDNSDFFYFIFTDVTEIFYVYFKLIFFLSFQVTTLMLLYHFFLFIGAGLHKFEFKYFKLMVILSNFINYISLIFAYFFIIPLSWNFFLSFQDLFQNKSFTIHFEIKLIEYFNFYISLYYICGLYFQIFILFFFIVYYFYNNNYKNIKKFRKIFYFGFIIFSTFLCPEIISQILVSFLFIIFYEVFMLLHIFYTNLVKQVTN